MSDEREVLYLAGEATERLATAPFGVLPVGSVEYHGPSAPLGTDTTLADGLARRLAERRDCLVFPPIAYTFVPRLTTQHGAGLSVDPGTFLAYATAVIGGVVGMGVTRLLVLNGHSENQYSLRLAAEQVTAGEPEASVLVCNWWRLAPDGLFSEADGHGHGGPLEISATAALDPRGVKLSGAMPADVPYEAPWWRGAAQVVGRGQAPAGFAGYHGKVSEIDVERGEQVVAGVLDELDRLVDDWLERAVTP